MKEMDMDPVEELHKIRREMYKKAGGTPEAFGRYLMERQKEYADRLVYPPPKPRRGISGKAPRSRKVLA